MAERVLPHDIDAERAVLGAAIADPAALERALSLLEHRDWFRKGHAQVFASAARLHAAGTAVDLVTLRADLAQHGELDSVGGPAYIAALIDGVPRASNVAYYAGIVREKWRRREAIRTAGKILADAYDSTDDASAIVAAATQRLAELSTCVEQVDDLSFVETLSAFVARVSDDAVPMLIDGLLPADGLTLNHGQPRSLKTWCGIEQFVALGTGTPAFGICAVREAAPALYVTNEDAEQRMKQRFLELLAGRGLTHQPETLHVAVHRGVWLDDDVWQARIISAAKRHGYRAIWLDPLRGLTSTVDKGPGEVQPFARYCRRLATEAQCAVVLSHHDTKPPTQGRDERKRQDRVSGGGLTSHCEAPVHFERIGESPAVTLLAPTSWKHMESPPPLEVTLAVNGGVATLRGRQTTTEEAESLAVHERVLAYLRDRPDVSGSKVAQGVKLNKASVLRVLEQLHERGRVDSRPGPRNGNLWFVTANGASGSSGSEWFQNH